MTNARVGYVRGRGQYRVSVRDGARRETFYVGEADMEELVHGRGWPGRYALVDVGIKMREIMSEFSLTKETLRRARAKGRRVVVLEKKGSRF